MGNTRKSKQRTRPGPNKPKKRRPQQETRYVGKGLTRKVAFRIAAKKRFAFRYDHRGASYDPATGKITYT